MVPLAHFVFWCGVSGCMLAGLLVSSWCFVCVFGVGWFSLLAGAGLGAMSFHYIYTRLFHN